MPDLYCAWLGIGASTGDRIATMRSACRALHQHPKVRLFAASSVYATSPVGPASQEFFNGALALHCELSPHELLTLLLEIEHQHGRVRTVHWGDRSLDLDLLLMRQDEHDAPWLALQDQALELPHPRICERDFVLVPLLDLLPELKLQGKPARHWLDHINSESRTIRRRIEEGSLWSEASTQTS